ncbi:hypothetical protein O0L34_g17027 [Tuta absoluta]|nr:hypothetical protein O0L34_g17027 [Tuta absoluta]
MSTMNSTRSSVGSHDRKLRYRAVLEDLSTLDDETANDHRMQKMESAVTEVKALIAEGDISERAKHPGEGYLDSRVLRATSDLAVRCSESISGNVNIYDKHELAEHIKENPDFWEFTFPLEVPAVAFLFGTFAPTPPEQRPRAPRRRVERQQAAEKKAPEKIDKLEKSDQASETVVLVKKFLTRAYREGGEEPLSYFHLVIDPNSFSKTVENIYHVSFLVRDGLVSIELDEEFGLPFVRPISTKQRDQRDISDENQFIVSIDMGLWEELKEAFKIRKPMMVLKK